MTRPRPDHHGQAALVPPPARDSFEEYVRGSAPRLKRLAYLLTGDPDTAEDLLQSAYAKVFPRWDRVRDYDDPDAYVRRVMVNTRTSWWRKLRGREFPTDAPPEAAVTSYAGLDSALALQDSLLRALRALPDKQRAAVVLRHYCDLSEADAAATMGTSVGAVKSNSSRGLAALRRALAPTVPTVTNAEEDR